MPLPLKKRVEIVEMDQQNLRNDFSFIRGEFKALKWILASLWFPALVGVAVTLWDHFIKH
jgi:hypothetical protein